MTEKLRADKCNNGRYDYICTECADKYILESRTRYSGSIIGNDGTCYICKKYTRIASSKKLLGLAIRY